MAQDGTFDDAKMTAALKRGHYRPEFIPMMIDSIRKASVSNPKSVMISVAENRYKLGMTDEDTFRHELRALQCAENLIPLYVFGANLDYTTYYTTQLITAYTDGVRAGNFSLEDYRQALLGLGLQPEKVEAYVFTETIRVKPSARTTVIGVSGIVKISDTGQVQLETIRRRRVKALISRAEEITKVQALGATIDYATAIADDDDSKIAEANLAELHKARPTYQTDAGKVKVSTVRDKRVKGIITALDESAALNALDMPADLVAATVDNDSAQIARSLIPKVGVQLQKYQTDAGQAEVDAIRQRRRNRTIERAQEIALLVALSMPADLANAIADDDDERLKALTAVKAVRTLADYETETGKLIVQTLRTLRHKQAITRDDLIARLTTLGADTDYATAVADYEDARLGEPPPQTLAI